MQTTLVLKFQKVKKCKKRGKQLSTVCKR